MKRITPGEGHGPHWTPDHRYCRLRGLETARVHGQFTEILETLLASVAKDGRERLIQKRVELVS